MAQLALSWRWLLPLGWITSENLVIFCPCCAFGSAHDTISSRNVFWIKDKPVLTKQSYQYLISSLKFHTVISVKYLFVCQPCIPMLQQHCGKVPGKQQDGILKGRLELHILAHVWIQVVL